MRTGLRIDTNNQLTRIIYPGQTETNCYRFGYSPNNDGLLSKKTEPANNAFTHIFDANGRLTDTEDDENGHWIFSQAGDTDGYIRSGVRTAENNQTTYLDYTDSVGAYTSTITDPAGNRTLFSQSSDGRTVSKQLPCGMNLGFLYDTDPQYRFKYLKEMTETAGTLIRKTQFARLYEEKNTAGVPQKITGTVKVSNKTFTVVDNIGQGIKTMTSPALRTVTSYYNPATLLTTKIQVPGLNDTEFGYDEKGRRTLVKTNTRQTSFVYNPQGNVASVTDPESHITAFGYDPVGRVTQITRPDTSVVNFVYDADGNMTVLTTPRPANHGFGYNKVNLPSSYTTPMSVPNTYIYEYDRDRRLKQINFPSGRQIKNIYATGRLTQIQTPEGNADIVYNCSNIGSISKGGESLTYTYDGSLLTSGTFSGTLNGSLTYTYNNDFAVTGFTYAGGTVSYAYDNDGLLTGAGRFTITRNALNGLPETVNSTGFALSRSFSLYGETDSETYTVGTQNVFRNKTDTRSSTGRILTKTETVGGTVTGYAYSYDDMGRLLTVTKNSALVEEYHYDAAGTRIYEMNTLRGITGKTLSYDADDRLLTAGTTTYQYDTDGFLKNRTDSTTGVTGYEYSSRGELLKVTLTAQQKIIEYVHDPLGRRIAKKINGTVVEKYLWQGMTRLLAVYDSNNNLLMRFEYADARMPFAMTAGGVLYYLSYDQVGSLKAVADGSGTVVKRIDYDSFGNIISDTNPAMKIPFGFAGGLHDRDTGLVRFGYRDYDPDTGRWTAKDPIGFKGGTDLYGYCVGDPVNLVDPNGLLWNQIVQIVGGLSTAYFGAGMAIAATATVIAAPALVAGTVLYALGATAVFAGTLDLLLEFNLGHSVTDNAGVLTFIGEGYGGETGRACGLAGDTVVDAISVGTGLKPKTIFEAAGTVASTISLGNDFVDITTTEVKNR